jgi:M6 family metalloprotease-like protein
MELLRSGNFDALNRVRGGAFFAPSLLLPGGQPTAVSGAFHVPVIPIAYRDVGVPFPTPSYQCLLFDRNPLSCGLLGDHPYSVTRFYEELSHHRITMDGVVFDPVRQDSVAAYYTDGCNAITVFGQTSCPARSRNRMGLMLIAALDSIAARPGGDAVWGQFDNDGPDGNPNSGDDDGVVDFVTFLQPEIGGECRSNSPVPTGVWSHRYVISGWASGLSHPHLDDIGRYLTRTPWQGHAGQFLKVNDYTIQSEVGGASSCDGTAIMAVGTVAHETGHAFGLPDLYDTRGTTQGIGGWGLMGSGNYARPYSPSSYDAWSLNALGWATIDSLGASRTVTAGPRLFTDTVFFARSNSPDVFVLLDNRQAILSDTAQMNPSLPPTCPLLGFCAKSPGLLIWLIDQPVVQQGLFPNTVNAGSVQGVSLIQADGLNQLRTPGSRNRGDRGDAYPGSTNNTGFTLLSNPGARNNGGEYLGFIIDRIAQLPAGQIRFRFTRRAASVIQAQNGAQIRVNGMLWDRFEEVLPGGDPVLLGAEEFQLLAGGKTRAHFLSWSNGGPREQTITSSTTKPDSLQASFSLEHRLLLVAGAGGTVTASVPGDLSAGLYLTQGTSVTLTATALPGFIFLGWRGDTVATGGTLDLSLRRGYDFEARFVAQVSVANADAVRDLLGTPTLTDVQRGFLDELGNRNGVLDVGDILAMFRRTGLAVPPAFRQAAEAVPSRRRGEVRP